MTSIEKILREALESIRDREWYENALDPQWAPAISREAIAKVDALPIDYRLPDYLRDDPWALQVMGHIDGLKAKVETSSITGEKAIEVSDKIVTDWLAEVGSDEHGLEWDDLADLKKRIAKALKGNV